MDPKKLTSKAVRSIFKPDHKSYLYRSRVPEYDNLTMLECLQDLENFDGGRTDKEGRENKAREDGKLTESSVRNLKEDDFEGNRVRLLKSKEVKLLRSQTKEVIVTRKGKGLAFQETFGKCNLIMPDEFTDRLLQVVSAYRSSGENVVDYSSVLQYEDTDGQKQLKKLEDAIRIQMTLMPTALTQCIARFSTVNEKVLRYHVLCSFLDSASRPFLLSNYATSFLDVVNGGNQEECLQALSVGEKEEVEQKRKGTEGIYFPKIPIIHESGKKTEYHGQTREDGCQESDALHTSSPREVELLKKLKANNGIGKLNGIA